jgi:signal transduction histidine kinase
MMLPIKWPLIRVISLVLGLTVSVLAPFEGLSQHIIELRDGQDDIVINPYAYLFKNTNASIRDIKEVMEADSSRFVRNEFLQEVTYGFNQPGGWCKFTVQNKSEKVNWVLRVHQTRVDSVQLYIKRENQEVERFPMTGHFHTIDERPVYALQFAFHIPIKKNEKITFFLYTQRQDGRHATILNLRQKNYFENYEHVFNNAISFISGSILLAGLIGFVLFFFIHQKVYLYYSVYCLSFFVLIWCDSGFALSLIASPKYQVVINTFTTIFYYWLMGWHILFTIEILRIRSYRYHWLYWLGTSVGWLFCVAAIVLLIPGLPETERWWLVYFCYYIVFFTNGFIMYAIVVSIARREPIVYFYMAGFLVTLVVATILVLADLQIIDDVNQKTDMLYFTPLVEILIMVIGLGIHFSNTVKERFRVQTALNKTQDQIITIQEDERKRIAQDLHDDVGNSLAAVKNLVIQKHESVVVEKEIDNVIRAIREISHNLMPVDFNEFPLPQILRITVNKFKNHPSLALEFSCMGEIRKLVPLTELVIYRIVNEIINNIFKHSRASSAFIQLIYQDESLVVTVEDDGIGINASKSEEGIGLRSIRSRAAYIHARLNIESDDKGTLIILEIPYEHS